MASIALFYGRMEGGATTRDGAQWAFSEHRSARGVLRKFRATARLREMTKIATLLKSQS